MTASSLACLRSLGSRGIPTLAVAEQSSAPELRSRFVNDRQVVPSPHDRARDHVESLLDLSRREDVKTILPIRETDVYLLATYADEFAEYVTTLLPSPETIESVYDRVQLVEAASAAGVPVPQTQRLNDVEDWKRELIVKPRYAILGHEYDEKVSPATVISPGSTQYLEPGVKPDRTAIRTSMHHEPIVQEFVPGSEFALWALYDEGEAIATCQKHQIRGYSFAGDASVARQTVNIPELERMGRALLDELEWHGPASVQFKRDSTTGEFVLLEVNPRFWLSVQCAIDAGVDFPYYYWQLVTGETPEPPERYETGVTTHLLRGELLYLKSVLQDEYPLIEPPPFARAVREVATSVLTQRKFDYLRLDDPQPFVRDVLNTALEGVNQAKEAEGNWTFDVRPKT